MQPVFYEIGSLDKKCYEEFHLSEDVLMEHAAMGMARWIEDQLESGSSVFIACGSGNNGGDGIALARLLQGRYDVRLFFALPPKSEMDKLQRQRADALGMTPAESPCESDLYVDAIFGSGFRGEPYGKPLEIIQWMNTQSGIKLACDIPSGLALDGTTAQNTFQADTTITMGAYKECLYADAAKDFVGDIIVADLGLDSSKYQESSDTQVLEIQDLQLPHRTTNNVHKGTYGHLSVLSGEKPGAAEIAARAALHFGVGLVTLVGRSTPNHPELMFSRSLPTNTTAVALGMGLGIESLNQLHLQPLQNLPLILDADVFHHPVCLQLLEQNPTAVLTPHPKEFASLLQLCDIADIGIQEIQTNRFAWVRKFSAKFPQATLLLKGANTLIAHHEKVIINPHGTPALAKGGSGDVLSGLIGALLAQGYEPFQAAQQASLAHALAAQKSPAHNYALTPLELINSIRNLS